MEKVEVKEIVFIKDAKDIRKDSLGKAIKKGTEMVCTGKALELFLKSGTAKLATDVKDEDEIQKIKKDN